jgi:hypothetical protein
VAEKWAQKCAKLEKGSAGFIFEATQEYAARKAEGWSAKAIAAEVTAAGFSIGERTVGRRLKALEGLEGSAGASAEAKFAAAYIVENDKASHSDPRLPQNDEGVAMVLEKAARELQDKHGWSLEDVKAEIAAAKPKSKAASVEAAPAPRITRYDLMVEFLDTIRSEFGDKPFTQREQTKAEEISLELQIRSGVEVR